MNKTRIGRTSFAEVTAPTIRNVRQRDKRINELARGKPMDPVLREA